MPRFHRYVLGMIFVIIGINLIGLWAVNVISLHRLTALERRSGQAVSPSPSASPQSTTSPQPSASPYPSASPSASTLKSGSTQSDLSQLSEKVGQVQSSITSIKDRLTKVEQAAQTESGATPHKTAATSTSTAAPAQAKETVVYIGSGSLHDRDWKDLTSAVVEINTNNYPRIKQVKFEATLSTINGEAQARLKNKGTGNVIYATQVMHNTSTPTIKLSAPFQLDSSSNQYIVQLRSSSGETVTLDGARLRIETY